MPILEEHPAALIRATTTNFSITPDLASLSRLQTSQTHLSQTHDAHLSTLHATLKRLARTHATLSAQHDLALSSVSGSTGKGAHAEEILALDTRKFRVAKECGDLEAEGERCEREVLAAERRMAELEAQEVGGEKAVDVAEARRRGEAEVLRLKIYRSLGVDVVRGGEGAKKVERVVVRDLQKGDVNVIEIEEGREGACVERIWGAM